MGTVAIRLRGDGDAEDDDNGCLASDDELQAMAGLAEVAVRI